MGQAYLLISFNPGNNDITYQLVAEQITELLVAHIHLPATSGQNGSVVSPCCNAFCIAVGKDMHSHLSFFSEVYDFQA